MEVLLNLSIIVHIRKSVLFCLFCIRSSLWHVGSALQHTGFSSCGPQAPGYMSSVVGVHGLSCSMACGILVPRPGIKPTLEGGLLTTGPPGKYQEGEKNSDRSLQCSVTTPQKIPHFKFLPPMDPGSALILTHHNDP